MRRGLGEEHPDTLMSMINLAWVYTSQGKLQEAVDLGERALEGQRRILGETHPHTLNSLDKLALMYHDIKQTTAAIILIEQSMDASQKILGESHPDTINRKRWLEDFRNGLNTAEEP
jgi:hypothetical protein